MKPQARTLLKVLVPPPVLAVALWVWYAWVEGQTLLDVIPDNHITASLRWALETNPDLTLLVGVVYAVALTVFVTVPTAVIAGHVWNRWGGKKEERSDD